MIKKHPQMFRGAVIVVFHKVRRAIDEACPDPLGFEVAPAAGEAVS